MGAVELTGRYGRLYGSLDWVMRLVAINLLWIAGTLAGVVIVGIAPATVAAYWLLREYSLGRRPQPWHGFWQQWRAELGQSQRRLGIPLATVIVLVFYLITAANQSGSLFRGLTLGLGLLLGLYVATLLYLPAVLNHYSIDAVAAWKVTVAAAWRQPLLTIGLVLTSAIVTVVMVFVIPGALPFFALSLPAYLATRAALRGFENLKER